MTPGRAFTEPDHSVVWDHSRCLHVEPGEDDVDVCDPTGVWTCHAPPGSYCVYGCDGGGTGECTEGWKPDPENPDQCEYGHKLEAHSCWVLPRVEHLDASDTYAGEVTRHVDGFIVVDEWGCDYLTWQYYVERKISDPTQAVLA